MADSIRTCVACRKQGPKDELLRFVRALDGEIRFDEKAVLTSRGAWTCADRACFEKAIVKRILFRNERTLPVSFDRIYQDVTVTISKNALSGLGLLRRMSKIESGKDAAIRAANEGHVEAIVFAKDLSKNSQSEVNEKVSKDQALQIVESNFLMEEMGVSLGRKKTGVVALSKSRITDEILRRINKLSRILERRP